MLHPHAIIRPAKIDHLTFRRVATSGGLAGLLLLAGCPPTVLMEEGATGTVGGSSGSGIGGEGGTGGIGGGPVACAGVEQWTSLGSAEVPLLSAYPVPSSTFAANRIFVWESDAGSVYDVKSNAWSYFSAELLSVREEAVVAAAGSRFVVWGGFADGSALDDGAIYDAEAKTWTPTASESAPSARRSGTAISTGDRVIVWGGRSPEKAVNTGASLDIATNVWTPITKSGAPGARFWHTAVWTGSSMIVWGGGSSQGGLQSGGVYDPATDTWKPTSKVGAPLERSFHGAVWTGSRMLVWGGKSSGTWPTDGGSYDPAMDTWALMSTDNAPAGRERPILLWTGSRLLVAGGLGGNVVGGPDVSIYDPATDTWQVAASPPFDLPTGSPLVAAWNGCAAVFWGSVDGSPVGWMYEPPPGS